MDNAQTAYSSLILDRVAASTVLRYPSIPGLASGRQMALFARRGYLVDCYRVAAAQAAVALFLVYALSTVFRFYGFSEEATGCANDEDVWQLPVPPLASPSRHLLTADKNQSVIPRVSAVTSSEILTFLRRTSDCPTVDTIGGRVFLASGWTKAVFSGVQDGRDVAVKVVDNTGHDIQECRKKRGEYDGASAAEKCRQSAERKLVKEAFVLRLLNSPHIVQVSTHVHLLLLLICTRHLSTQFLYQVICIPREARRQKGPK